MPLRAAVLWSDPGATLIYNSGSGRDILKSALKRDDAANDTLYFKLHVAPVSDSTTEEYFAGLELYEGDSERLGIGNALPAWAYSAYFGTQESDNAASAPSYIDLHSSSLEASGSGAAPKYEFPRRGVERTIVFKVQYVPGGDDLVTVWLNPDLTAGATEIHQPEALTTRFSANASFDEIRLRHGGGGGGWVFSDLAVASSFGDFVDPSSAIARASETGPLFNAQRYSVETWLREPGMPRTAIRALAQTADGYIWVAGDDRLTRFDGVRFVPVDLRLASTNPVMRTLAGDSRGALWIGTRDNGLLRLVNGQVESFGVKNGLPAGTINAIAEAGDGSVWIGTSAGVAAWRNGVISTPPGLESLLGREVKALFSDRSGVMWIGAVGDGISRYDKGKLTRLADSKVDDLLRDPQSLVVDSGGRLWSFAGDDFVLCREGAEWRRFRIPRQTGARHARVLAAEPDGSIWVGSAAEGLFQIKQGKLAALDSNLGLPDSQVSALLVDRDGNLWIGGGSGLHLMRPKPTVALGQNEGLGHGAVSAVAEVAPGVIWAIQPGRGLLRWEGGSFRPLNPAGYTAESGALGAMLVAHDGACWIACTNGLLLFRNPQAVADEGLFFPLPAVNITTLAEDQDGSIWAGTRQGHLWRLHQGRWKQHAKLSAGVAITALVSKGADSVWAGTDGAGLWLIDSAGQARSIGGEGLSGSHVRSLYCDRNGRLWIGTASGLVTGAAAHFATVPGLPDNNILEILEDAGGRLWLNDGAGLTCIVKPASTGEPAEVLGNYAMGVNRSDDTPQDPGRASAHPKGCRTSSGRLWFGTFNGLYVVEPPQIGSRTNAPTLIVEELLVDGASAAGFKPVSTLAGLSLAATARPTPLRIGPGKHRLEINYTSPQFNPPERLRFRYRMEGLDQDWVEAGAARTARYSYLPPGNYRFLVSVFQPGRAVEEAGFDLSISPYPWQRWWVVALALVGFLLSIVSTARFVEKQRLNRQLRRLVQENALERERTRIAQDLHDEMGAKLCRISFLSEHAGRLDPASGELKQQVATIANDSRELLHSLDEIVWVVNPQNDTLEHVVSYLGQYAQDYFSGTGVECELDTASELPQLPVSSQTRHHLFLAVHEALTNVLKHSGASRVKLTIAFDGATLSLQVKDNGRGFTMPAFAEKSPRQGESGNGLLNMQQRLQSLGGQCRIESVPGGGTTIDFHLRLPNPERPGALS